MISKHLLIRPSTFSDCALFAKWELQENIKKFFTIDASYDYEKIVKEFLFHSDDDTHLQFTIIHRPEDKPIGRIWLSQLDGHNQSLDITRIYIGDDDFRGKGFGKEAMIILLKFCFDTLRVHRVSLDYFSGNDAAKSLYLSLGFQSEGALRQCVNRDGDWFDLNLMSILSHEYDEVKDELAGLIQ